MEKVYSGIIIGILVGILVMIHLFIRDSVISLDWGIWISVMIWMGILAHDIIFTEIRTT